jgi:hypothetical protein
MEFAMRISGLLILSVLIITITAAYPAYAALTVDVTFDQSTPEGVILQNDLSALVETEIANELSKYSNVPKLAKGFGNASAYASHASTLRGYQGYDLFAISAGSMVSIQAPNGDPMFFQDLSDDIDNGDIYAGVGVTPVVVQAGLNLGFIIDGLYLSFMYGKYSADIDQGDYKIDHDENLIGFDITYQLLSDRSILAGLLVWRGLSINTGAIHYKNTTTFYNKMDKINNSQAVTGATVDYTIDPSVNFEIATEGNVIPVEIYTAVRIFYILNIGAGGGFDYVVNGKTTIELKSAGDVLITNSTPVVSGFIGQTGKITVNADTSGIKSDRYRPKLLANIGLGIGPVFIDVPVTYYLDNGYSVGITAGCVW